MTGEHLQELLRRVVGMNEGDVATAQSSWKSCALALDTVTAELLAAGPRVRAGFGQDTDVGIAAERTFTAAAERIEARQQQLVDAAEALREVWLAMRAAQGSAQDAPDEPGERPEIPPSIGDDVDDIVALKQHISRVNLYNNRVAAYADADADAQQKVQRLLARYAEASSVLSDIHGDVDVPPQPDGPGGPGAGPGGATRPTGSGSGSGAGSGLQWSGTSGTFSWSGVDTTSPDHGGRPETGHPEWPVLDPVVGGPVPGPEWPDAGPQGPGTPPGLGPSVIGGVAAAGVFGAPGLVNGVRSLLAGRTAGGGLAPQAIGTSQRSGAPGSLGRSGAGTPGSPVARSGRGGAGGGRGPAAAGAAGGRGARSRDERDDADRDLFDDGEDWIDDEGHAPGVLD